MDYRRPLSDTGLGHTGIGLAGHCANVRRMLYNLRIEQLDPSDDRNILDGINVRGDSVVVITNKGVPPVCYRWHRWVQSHQRNVLGFCSLALSYAEAASKQTKAEPKPETIPNLHTWNRI